MPLMLPMQDLLEPVAATFNFRTEEGKSLKDVSRLDTMVTVVDAANLLRDYASTDFLKDRGEEDNRTLVNLLVDQIEFADVIILNKIDAATPEQLDACLVGDANAKAIQPAAWKKLKDPFPIWKRAEPS